jgi:hypothetical protein
LRKIGAGRLAEVVARQLENTLAGPMQRLHLADVEWSLDLEDLASGTRGFQATMAGTGQRFEFTVREVTPDPEDLPVRYYDAAYCYGNSDAEVRAAALRKAAEAFPGSVLEISGSYNLYDTIPRYEETLGHGYAGEKFSATTIRVKATG